MAGESQFDHYADDYDAALARGLSVSGEGRDFFASGRLAFLGRCLRERQLTVESVLDFGCGTGASVPLIQGAIGARIITGVDESRRSIAAAAQAHGGPGVTFSLTAEHAPAANFDLVYTNGVFHHIPVAERPAALSFIRDVLKPGGLFSFWENNPWSLGARYVMSKIPFDRDAVMVSARQARDLARQHGFRVLRTDYLFIFPAALKILRPLEELARRAPLGAQYQVLCAKAA
jgi:SAM-dependent methyltransferase